jgi:hypothetical protein
MGETLKAFGRVERIFLLIEREDRSSAVYYRISRLHPPCLSYHVQTSSPNLQVDTGGADPDHLLMELQMLAFAEHGIGDELDSL